MIMRKYNNCLAGIFMGLFTLLAIHSCLDDDDWANSFEDTLLGMGTVQTLDEGDYYFLLADLEAFNNTMHQIEKDYLNREKWNKMAILNVARIGYFSSDRAVMDYANNIWHCHFFATFTDVNGD